jgi:hypothetical protein
MLGPSCDSMTENYVWVDREKYDSKVHKSNGRPQFFAYVLPYKNKLDRLRN